MTIERRCNVTIQWDTQHVHHPELQHAHAHAVLEEMPLSWTDSLVVVDMQAHTCSCPQGPAESCMQDATRSGLSPRCYLTQCCCMALLLPGHWATWPPQPWRCPVQLAAARPRARRPRPTAASSTSPPEQAHSRRSPASLLHRSSHYRQQVMHTWGTNRSVSSLSYQPDLVPGCSEICGISLPREEESPMQSSLCALLSRPLFHHLAAS